MKQKEISYDAVYYHFLKWSRDGSLQKVWEHSIMTIAPALNLSEINLDGSHGIAKKSGEAVALPVGALLPGLINSEHCY